MRLFLRNQFQKVTTLRKEVRYKFIKFDTPEQLVKLHFSHWSSTNHVNFKIFNKVLIELGGRPAHIVETGSSAWGTDSTRLWDKYVKKYGGIVYTVDIRRTPKRRLRLFVSGRTHFRIGNSVDFLHSPEAQRADLYFLDSFDVDYNNPMPAAKHGLAEFNAICAKLKPGSLLLIDDTPSDVRYLSPGLEVLAHDFRESNGFLPGKGAMVLPLICKNAEFEVLLHEYAFLAKKIN